MQVGRYRKTDCSCCGVIDGDRTRYSACQKTLKFYSPVEETCQNFQYVLLVLEGRS